MSEKAMEVCERCGWLHQQCTCDKQLLTEIKQLRAEVAYWQDKALGHIACEQHTETHVGEMVECPFCVADRLRAKVKLLEDNLNSKPTRNDPSCVNAYPWVAKEVDQ